VKLRRGDWLATFGVSIATIWTLGVWELQRDLPLVFPSRERICATYAQSGDLPQTAQPPVSSSRLFEVGVPYWATWAKEAQSALPKATAYPACIDQDRLFDRSNARFAHDWQNWFNDNGLMLLKWLIAPFFVAPVVLLVIVTPYVMARRSVYRRKHPAQGAR
jgi:hypothetical protein